MALQLTNSTQTIEVYNTTSGDKETLIKGSFRTILRGEKVILLLRTGGPGASYTPEIVLNWREITTPSGLTSASDLYDALVGWAAQVVSGGASGVGGGNNTYYAKPGGANADATATYAAATQITITGMPFTFTANDIESIEQKPTSGDSTKYTDKADFAVSAGVITVTGASFSATDEFIVIFSGPDKAYDKDLDVEKMVDQSADYLHYTDVEHIVDESNLGITSTSTGGDTNTLVDSGADFDAEDVAEGYTAYQTTDGESALIDSDSLSGLAGDGGVADANTIETGTLSGAATWDTKDYSLPQVKRFEIPMDSYKHLSVDILLDSQDANNSCYIKIYATNDENADTTDDIYWKDISTAVFGAAELSADGIGDAARAVTQGIYFIDTDYIAAKYMIKIVAECDNGTPNNESNIRIKKGY